MAAKLSFPLFSADADTVLVTVNDRLSKVGLSITREEALMLADRRTASLASTERVESGAPALAAIAEAVATSPYLLSSEVASVLASLQGAFYALRDELPVDVPDAEIAEALHGWFDAWGDATEAPEASADEVMAFSPEYVRAQEVDGDVYRIVDDEGRAYTFDPDEWDYDEQAKGWEGERWADDWDD